MASRSLKNRLLLAAGAAMAIGTLAGCAGPGMAVRSNSADSARLALKNGKAGDAVSHAEAAVAATPRDASLRVLLGQAYFKAGRFTSAAATFDDAMKLGDNSARTALSLALAHIGAGDQHGALAVLEDWRGEIPVSDLGLALSLAGEPDRGVSVLTEALRGGDNTAKLRQNLAYSYALAGKWREARAMAAQDVPADQIDARIAEWAGMIQPEQYQQRIAALLETPMRSDPGQPAMLALANNPAMEQLAAETTANAAAPVAAVGEKVAAVAEVTPVQVAPAQAELPAADATAPEPAPAPPQQLAFAPAFAPYTTSAPTPAPVPASEPVIQMPAAKPVHVVAFAAKPRPTSAAGTHLVQLGSFSSPQGARRAWGIYTARNASLASYRMNIAPAVVRGKHVWRVAAAGLVGSKAAYGLCSRVKSGGGACFAYAAAPARPMPGTVPSQARAVSGPQMARRR
ncbi:MAG: tetratricopeptide repeat protein [Novosphingobium sp.]